ncbi:MAG: PIG-L family deacetylase [Proteobacteria bacterium]|nr:PIG-L family deacetylase [Pseudomonadota bacterium]
MKTILVVAAHPDDEILGCGGTISRLAREGYEVHTLILGEGITSRDNERDVKNRKNELDALKKQAYDAAHVVGVKEVYLFDFPDNRFDSIPLLDIVKTVENIKIDIKPDIVFTHYEKDLNVDHKITYKAVIVATRPLKDETVKELYTFKTLSSTEWNYPLNFVPDVFYDISNTLDIKLKAANMYKSELKEFPHPRSIKGIKVDAEYWGMCSGYNYAEAFKCVRIIR